MLKELLLLAQFIGSTVSITRLPCKVYANFNIILHGMADTGLVGNTMNAETARQCTLHCVSWPKCKSLNYRKSKQQCELLKRGLNKSKLLLKADNESVYMTTNELDLNQGETCVKLSPCHNGAICEDNCDSQGYKCTCKKYYYGKNCEKIIQDCAAVKDSGKTQNGVYEIKANFDYKINVYCDLTTSTRDWIVIQRRIDGTVDFYRNWQSYKTGFGDIQGNYWIGLDQLHKLAGPGRGAILRIDITHRNNPNSTYYARYSVFEIGDEASGYKLLIQGYQGNANDSMAAHDGMKFSTYDSDNDLSGIENCAQMWKGGWWYNHCHLANLNGLYPTKSATTAEYMSWHNLHSSHGDIIYSDMKIKYDRR